MRNKSIILLILLLFIIPLVSSLPAQVSGDSGVLEISYPRYEYIKLNGDDFNLYFHVFNTTDVMTNISTTCKVDLYNPIGTEILSETGSYTIATEDFYVLIDRGNFSSRGIYTYIIYCDSTSQTGFASGTFTVTGTGLPLTVESSIYYSLVIITLVFFFIITISSIPRLPSGNNTDGLGNIISINNLKYLRPVLYIISWGILLSIMFILSNIGIGFLETTMVGTFLLKIYQGMFWLTIPFMFLWFIYILVELFRDSETKRMIERGIDIGSAP